VGELQFFRHLEEIKDECFPQPKDIGGKDEEFRQKKSDGRNVENIDGGKSGFKILFSLGEDDKKVEKKRREYEKCDLVQPVKKAVQDVQLTRRRKGIERVQHQRHEKKEDIRKREWLFRIQKNDEP
jgi:hypothetical protein